MPQAAISMPTKASRRWEAKHEANLEQMRQALKANGITTPARRKKAMQTAQSFVFRKPSDVKGVGR